MDSNLKVNQRVKVARERGTEENAVVKAFARSGQVIVIFEDGEMDAVDREDVTPRYE